jgi:hypothetical protein
MRAPKKNRPTEKLQPWRAYLLRRRNRFLEIVYAFKIAEDLRRRLIVQPHGDCAPG